jgi:hypothetical protein
LDETTGLNQPIPLPNINTSNYQVIAALFIERTNTEVQVKDFYNAENRQKVAEKTREGVFIASRFALPISLVLD